MTDLYLGHHKNDETKEWKFIVYYKNKQEFDYFKFNNKEICLHEWKPELQCSLQYNDSSQKESNILMDKIIKLYKTVNAIPLLISTYKRYGKISYNIMGQPQFIVWKKQLPKKQKTQ